MEKLDMTPAGHVVPYVSDIPTLSPDNTGAIQQVSAMLRTGVACYDDDDLVELMHAVEDRFDGKLLAAASAVTAGMITFEATTSGSRWRMLQGRAAS